MSLGRILAVLAAAGVLALSGAASAQPSDGIREAVAAANTEPVDQLARDVDHLHPIAMGLLAKRLFDMNRKDEAVFWFYEAQLRWLARFNDYPALGREGSALGGESEGEMYGRVLEDMAPDINRYAIDDVPAYLKTLDRVLAWDAAHPNAFAPLGPGREKARKQIADGRASVEAHADELRKKSAEFHAAAVATPPATSDDPYPGDGGGMFQTPQELVPPCTDRRFDGFSPGATTKADIARALGKPESWFTDPGGTSEYRYACSGEPMRMGGMSMTERLSISFKFDAKHVLTTIDRQKPKG